MSGVIWCNGCLSAKQHCEKKIGTVLILDTSPVSLLKLQEKAGTLHDIPLCLLSMNAAQSLHTLDSLVIK